jgi:hypothetical protein
LVIIRYHVLNSLISALQRDLGLADSASDVPGWRPPFGFVCGAEEKRMSHICSGSSSTKESNMSKRTLAAAAIAIALTAAAAAVVFWPDDPLKTHPHAYAFIGDHVQSHFLLGDQPIADRNENLVAAKEDDGFPGCLRYRTSTFSGWSVPPELHLKDSHGVRVTLTNASVLPRIDDDRLSLLACKENVEDLDTQLKSHPR